MNTKIMKITPEMAEKFLSLSKGNRNTSPITVAKYAKMMRRGEWVLSSDFITFDENGVLINGHHRLMAIIESGVTVEIGVLVGVPHDNVQAIDIGKSRTLTDVVRFALPGIADVNNTVATARFLLGIRFRNGHVILPNDGGFSKSVFTQKDIIAFVSEHYNELMDAVKVVGSVPFCRVIFRSVAYRLRNVNRDKVQYFFDRCRDGAGLEAGSPILLLRNKLLGYTLHGADSYKTALFYVHTAWNLYVMGETRKILKMAPGAKVPELIFGEKIEETGK